MEKIKNQKLNLVLVVVIAALVVAYIATMTLPFITYTRLEPAEVAGKEETISLMQYVWVPYNYADLTNKIIPEVHMDEFGVKYNITKTVPAPLFGFVGGLITIAVAFFLRKKFWSIFFPIVWSVVGAILYFTNTFFTLSIINPATFTVHMIIFAITLLVALENLILYSIPLLKYNRANREI